METKAETLERLAAEDDQIALDMSGRTPDYAEYLRRRAAYRRKLAEEYRREEQGLPFSTLPDPPTRGPAGKKIRGGGH